MADLGKILITPKGEYNKDINYESLDIITYNGSSYLVLKDIKGITPSNDMINYMMSAQGYPGNASGVECVDTQSISGGGGGISNVQSLIDILADKVVNNLVTNENLNTKLNEYILKSMMSNIQINNTENIPTSALVYSMDQVISSIISKNDPIPKIGLQLNNDLNNCIIGEFAIYNTSMTNIVASLLNKPNDLWRGEILLIWVSTDTDRNYGYQIIIGTGNGKYHNIYFRQKRINVFSEWIKLFDNQVNTHVYEPITGMTVDEIDSIYNNISSKMRYQTHYTALINHGISYGSIGGGTYYLEGVKTTDKFEYQYIYSYYGHYYRRKIEGVWESWIKK